MAEVPTLENYLIVHPDADPATMVQVLLNKLALVNAENEKWNQEYRISTEVELDENLNYKPKTLAQLQRLARVYSESSYVPDHFKNLANAVIGVQMALRCRVDIMTFLQSCYIVHNKPGIEGKLVIAMLNSNSAVDGRVDFEKTRGPNGKVISCLASAKDAKTGKVLSELVTWEMVEAEGWNKPKQGQPSKWMTLPDLMFAYRSATFLARVHFPDVLMGMRTVDELEDIGATNGEATTVSTVPAGGLQELSERLGAAPKAITRKKKEIETVEGKAEPTKTPATDTTPSDTKQAPKSEETKTSPANEAQASKGQSEAATQEANQTGSNPETDEGDQSAGEEANDQTQPDFITDPVPRPELDIVGCTFEKKIIGKRSPEELRKFAESEVKGNPDLFEKDIAYLTQLCLRRAWQLENGHKTTDRVPGGK